MADIFREIDEEIRREQFSALVRRFGPYVLAVVLAALIGTGAVLWWRSHQVAVGARSAAAFIEAQNLLDAGKAKEAAEAFGQIASASAGSGYPALARLQEAEARVQMGDHKGAVAAYDALAAHTSDNVLKQLAQWKAALLLVGEAPRQEIETRLAPLLDGHSPFRFSAREVRAAAALQANDREAAITMLQQISDDFNAPPGLQKRAREILTALGAPPKTSALDEAKPDEAKPQAGRSE